jgi:hypothetical protein
LLGPAADRDLAPLASEKIRAGVLRAHLVWRARAGFQRDIGMPMSRVLLKWWLAAGAGSSCIEALGLPRMAVDELLGDDALTLHVDPRKLLRSCVYGQRKGEKRPSSIKFIWDGDWDLCRCDTRLGSHYRFFTDLDTHRGRLEETERYQELMEDLERGRPWQSHREGILLDTPERIRQYLEIYLRFMDTMAAGGFDQDRAKDELGVAITRNGTILKIRKGLHRHAMAQRVGLPSIPVRVRAIHRQWWNEVTAGTTGREALERVCAALAHCLPEQDAGTLDPEPSGDDLTDAFWPRPRVHAAPFTGRTLAAR